jgi:hypothetical protein
MAKPLLFPSGDKPQLLQLANKYAARRPVTTPYSLDESADVAAIRPEFQTLYLEDLNPRPPTAQELLAKALNERARANREAVDLRRQTLIDQGDLGYQPPASVGGVNRYIRDRLPFEQHQQLHEAVEPQDVEDITVREMPGIGKAVQYGPAATVVTGRYGTGVATKEATPNPKRTIEGIPAAEWFKQAANRQGISNKFAKTEDPGASPEARKERFKARGIV